MEEAPRRLAADNAQPELRARVRVYIDGDMLRDIMAYDVDQGWVLIVQHDDNGHRRQCSGEWLCERVYGRVKAVLL